MAYSGFLLKIGDYEFPKKYIAAEQYSAYINTQTIDPFTDGDGKLHVDFLPLAPLKVEFNTPELQNNKTFSEIMTNIKNNCIDTGVKRKFYCTAYIPELDDYVTELAYLSDFQPTMYYADDNTIKYKSVRFAIIGGIAEDD